MSYDQLTANIISEIKAKDAEIELLRAEVAALREDALRLRATLINVRLALEVAGTTPNGPICDTIWYSNHETLFDYIDAAIDAARAKGGT